MVLIQIKFAFPFRLGLPETLLWTVVDGSLYCVRAYSLSGVRNDTYGKDPSEVPSTGQAAWYKTDLVKENNDKRPNREVMFTGDPLRFLGKVKDYVAFTFEVNPAS